MSVVNSPKLSTTTLNISENPRLHIQYSYRNQCKIYLEKFAYEVCCRRKCRVRHLTPLTLDDLFHSTEAPRIVFHTPVQLASHAKFLEWPSITIVKMKTINRTLPSLWLLALFLTAQKTKDLHGKSHAATLRDSVRDHFW